MLFRSHCEGFGGRLRVGVVGSELGFVFGDRGLAGSATIPLDAALAVPAELAGSVITASACHGLFPLAFLLRKAQNQVERREIGLPGFCLAPPTDPPASGALTVNGLWWFDSQFHREPAGSDFESDTPHRCTSCLKRSVLIARGVSYWTQEKSFLVLRKPIPNLSRRKGLDLCKAGLKILSQRLQRITNPLVFCGSRLTARAGNDFAIFRKSIDRKSVV